MSISNSVSHRESANIKMESRFSSFSSTSTYSHLLYLNDHERFCYLSGPASPKARQESLSFFSTTSSHFSDDLERSDISELSSHSTDNVSLISATIPTAKFAENHYPLITSLDPSQSYNLKSGPPNHFAFTVARHMVAIHNSFIRALNSSYNHALSIKPATQRCKDFLKFNQVMFQMLDHHYNIEGTFLYSAFEQLLEQPGAMDSSLRAHQTCMDGLATFQHYIFAPETIHSFDGVQFRRMIEMFGPELIQHLHDEIPTLFSLRITDSSKVRKIWSQAIKMRRRNVDPYIVGPFILGCQDRDFLLDGKVIEGYPGFSWIAETVLRKWHAKKHAGVWEFLPSDLHGAKRTIMT